MSLYSILVIAVVGFIQCDGKITCMDANGNPVDWFIIYKLPRDEDSSNPLIREGVAHLYLDVNTEIFSLSKVSLNETNQAVAYTLQQIYDNHSSKVIVYMLYNDEFPDGPKPEDNGHTKGDIAFDKDTGFWLVHSIPKFPDYSNRSYWWPHNALVYGQSMLCISMETAEFVKVAHQLLFNFPAVYDYNIPSSFRSRFADLVSVSENRHVTQSPWNSSVLLTSLKGQDFRSFAKFSFFEEDLYWYWVAPALGDALHVETWLNTASRLPSFCNGSYNVENVKAIAFKNVISFNSSNDHSKWASTKNKKWTCIGDINRTGSQYKRAGGTVCAQIPMVWSAFNLAIEDIEKCPGHL